MDFIKSGISSSNGVKEALAKVGGVTGAKMIPAVFKTNEVGDGGMNRRMPLRLRAPTAHIDNQEVDFMVLKFVSHDDGKLSHLGQGAKESTWLVQAGHEGQPFEIKTHVDQTILTSPEVRVQCNRRRVFPREDQKKAKLREDFVMQWPFRGEATGIGQRDIVEIRPGAFENDQWHSGTLTKQRPDGLFEALVRMTDGSGGFREVAYPAVPASNIRYTSTGKPFFVPNRTLKLEVPANDPAHATFTVDNEPLTQFFARPTPNPARGQNQAVVMKVSKDWQTVTSNVGHQVFAHHISNEVRAVNQSLETHRRSWTIQIGPFAQHTIVLENHRISKLVTLTIDGEKLVEATAEEIGCSRDNWKCKFRFVGQRCIDYEVYETNVNGHVLNTRATVSEKLKYSRECVVSFSDESNLASANLVVEGVSFRDLNLKRDLHQEAELKMSPLVLHETYGVACPHKVNEQAPNGLTWCEDALSEGLATFRGVVSGAIDAPPNQAGALSEGLAAFRSIVTGTFDAPPKQAGALSEGLAAFRNIVTGAVDAPAKETIPFGGRFQDHRDDHDDHITIAI